MSSQFDPSQFLDAQTTEAGVKRSPIPAGLVVQGLIKEIKAETWSKKDDPSKNGMKFNVVVEVDLESYPDIKSIVGADKVTLNDSIMLDVKPTGEIDWAPGKNGKFRRYREALGLNTPGQPFSARMMEGRTLGVKISHREYQGEIFDQIDSPVKAA